MNFWIRSNLHNYPYDYLRNYLYSYLYDYLPKYLHKYLHNYLYSYATSLRYTNVYTIVYYRLSGLFWTSVSRHNTWLILRPITRIVNCVVFGVIYIDTILYYLILYSKTTKRLTIIILLNI